MDQGSQSSKENNSTQGTSSSKSDFASAPSISLPKGGGAIKGMGEKFAANPVTGTGSMSVPIATSPGRSGFAPQLSLSYDSGAGNGPFGLGWQLSIPSLTRKTDKGLPKYQDAEESNVFILSGAEDLVPVLVDKGGGNWERVVIEPRTVSGQTYQIQHYRPRIEGLFARIERWTNQSDPNDSFWRSISKDNITTWYGKTETSRIADPSDPAHIFSWLICESYDDKGNVIEYQYKKEDSDGVDVAQAHECNRSPATRETSRYLKTIKYGNHTPYYPLLTKDKPWPVLSGDGSWFFEVVFDFGEHDANNPMPLEADKHWPVRNDPFSSYRAGFEVRTYRLCQRVLMFHHFPDEGNVGANCLVRSTDFTYSYEEDPKSSQNPIYSFLLSGTQTGYKRNGTGGYLSKSLPPLEFEYSAVPTPEQLQQEPIRTLDKENLDNLPYGIDGSHYQWVDLDGEGLSGVLTEQGGGWFYKRNQSPVNVIDENNKKVTLAQFGALETVINKPSLGNLTSGHQQLLDLAGDGQLDLVEFEAPTPGFYERTENDDWQPFVPFTSLPNLNWGDPNLKFIDLTGDGHADVIISHDNAFCWHESLAEAGFGPEEKVLQSFDEEQGPKLLFADSTQSTFLADLSGDGLTDLVRIRNSEVCYWPNLGYGRFGAKVTMDNSPWLDAPDLFDGRRIRLADIDGSGTTDIFYLSNTGIQFYYNQSGNAWSQPCNLDVFPDLDHTASVTVMDFLGNGTTCLVWSSSLPVHAEQALRYMDLMGGQKPHLLIREVNNLGSETRVQYAPSTKFYVADRLAGKPWLTRIPFPVHVVEQVETFDWISRNYFVTRYAYHHGYYDGIEREFRGFGMVEQWDTEEIATLSNNDTHTTATNWDAASNVPPVYTKTWFHNGAFFGEERISKHFEQEYYHEGDASEALAGLSDDQLQAMLLEDTVLPITIRLPDGSRIPYTLSPEEAREASRALKGSILRQEIYGLDNSDEADRPYSVSERNYTIEMLQPRHLNRFAVFFAHARETVDFHYERKLFPVLNGQLTDPVNPPAGVKLNADPRVTHAVTLSVDEWGNVLRAIAIGYGRRYADPALTAEDQAKQQITLMTLNETLYTNPILSGDVHRARLPAEANSYEIFQIQADPSWPKPLTPDITHLYRFEHLSNQADLALQHQLPYEDWQHTQAASGQPSSRLIEALRAQYRPDDLGASANNPKALLPLGTLQPLALAGESYKLAFTLGLLTQIYQRGQTALLPNPAGILASTGSDGGGYVDLDGDGHWWIPTGRVYFDPDPNARPQQELDQAKQHFFLPRRFVNPFGESGTADYDGYDLLPIRTTDALQNSASAQIDYRLLQPELLIDSNGNRSQVVFDALGLVAGTAVMGKTTENKGDSLTAIPFNPDLTQTEIDDFFNAVDPHIPAPNLLKDATSRIIYDIDRFRASRNANPNAPDQWRPVLAATLARETHVSDLQPNEQTKIQLGFSYSDGFGREIQKKIQAEPGKLVPGGPIVNPRWVGSGWTIFNNKCKPVRQYEPFFDDTHDFRFGNKAGVSPILFYDPAERVVATIHPNHTWGKVIFDPWRQESWDVSDTVLLDPKSDAEVGGYFTRLPDADVLPAWHQLRTDPSFSNEFAQRYPDATLRNAEADAASKAAVHAATPTVAHFDTLGRPFLTVSHNRFERNQAFVEEKYATRVEIDIEGNQRAVRDAIVQNVDVQGRVVMRYDYDLLGSKIHQASMEAGERWMLNDVTGKPIRAWDSRGHAFRSAYDPLRRPVKLFVQGTDAVQSDPRTLAKEVLVGLTEYGEGQPKDVELNLRTRVFRHFDSAGVVTSMDINPVSQLNEAYDFKGNPLCGTRQLVQDYKNIIDWSANPALDQEIFQSATTFDALNRPIKLITPDNSIVRPTYNEANLLERMDVQLQGAAAVTAFVANIDYDAKGQLERIQYGSGVRTNYQYDPETFRLTRLTTTRPTGLNGLTAQLFKNAPTVQDLNYTYDPAGNLTRIADEALPVIFNANQQVDPIGLYTYDALYRLIKAQGRESIGQSALQLGLPQASYRDYPYTGLGAQPFDPKAVQTYTEQYEYDAVGNFLHFIHRAGNNGWQRDYYYEQTSLTEAGKFSNQLSKTVINPNGNQPVNEPYAHDVHGNMTFMPQMSLMQWDYQDRLIATARQVVSPSPPPATVTETTYYVYDGAGQRVRKITEGQNGTRQKERIYLGGYEIWREYDGAGANVTLERQTLHVMDDKQRVALVETRTVGSDPSPGQLIRYQLGNHLGSASLELDDQGQLISYEEYHPYGTTAYQAGRSSAEISLKRYRYTGKERDEETGFSYHGARYYAPWLGRWTAADPAMIADGTNIYTNARDNPTRLIDLTGLSGEEPEKQLYFSEAEVFDADATTTKHTRGFSKQLYAHFRRLRDLWTGPKNYDLSDRTPFIETPAFVTRKVGIEESSANRSRGPAERAAADTSGNRARIHGTDNAAPSGVRQRQPTPPKIAVNKPKPIVIEPPPPPPAEATPIGPPLPPPADPVPIGPPAPPPEGGGTPPEVGVTTPKGGGTPPEGGGTLPEGGGTPPKGGGTPPEGWGATIASKVEIGVGILIVGNELIKAKPIERPGIIKDYATATVLLNAAIRAGVPGARLVAGPGGWFITFAPIMASLGADSEKMMEQQNRKEIYSGLHKL